MRILLLVLSLLAASVQAQTNGLLTWTFLSTSPVTNYSVNLFKSASVSTLPPWPLYLVTNNPATNQVQVPLNGSAGYFYGKYAKTNYVVTTNATLVTNSVVSTNFTYVTNSTSSVTLAWNTSPEVNVTSYRLYQGLGHLNYTNYYVATSSQISINNLNGVYFFAVTALTDTGIESDFSSEISYSTTEILTNSVYATNEVVSTNFTYNTTALVGFGDLTLSLKPIFTPFSPFRTNFYTFTNFTLVTIRDQTNALPYPSTIVVSGITGLIDKVTVTVRGLAHTWVSDADLLLASPTNQSVMLMSDAGTNSSVTNMSLTFDDTSSNVLPRTSLLTNGTYHTTNYAGNGDFFPAPAPAISTTNLNVFKGKNPNGTWKLFASDTGPNDSGKFTSWELNFTIISGNGLSGPMAGRVRTNHAFIKLPDAPMPPTNSIRRNNLKFKNENR